MQHYILSIIIPLYNSEKVIERTINNLIVDTSLFAKSIEIILIDDGSTDNTSLICSKIVNQQSNVKYFYKNNSGIADSRNFGASKASGDFLFFHDHDDRFESKNFDKIIEILLSHNGCDLFLFSSDIEKDGILKPWVVVKPHLVKNENEIHESLFRTAFGLENSKEVVNLYNPVWSVVFRKSFFINKGLLFIRYCAYEDDFVCLIKALLSRPKIVLTDLKIYNWIVNQESTSHTYNFDEQYLLRIPSYINFISETIEQSDFKQYRDLVVSDFIRHKYMMFVNWFCKNKKGLKKFKFLCKKYSIRDIILHNKAIKKSLKNSFLSLLFFLRSYSLIYFLIKKSRY